MPPRKRSNSNSLCLFLARGRRQPSPFRKGGWKGCPATPFKTSCVIKTRGRSTSHVIPAKAGIQFCQVFLDSRLRGSDDQSAVVCGGATRKCKLSDNPLKEVGFFICFTLAFCCFLINAVWAYTPEDCVRCHREGGKGSSLQIDLEAFKQSVHGATLSCLDCHVHIQDESHETMKASGAVSCTECHEQKNRHGLSRDRGQRPTCSSCHTKHRILSKGDPSSSVHSEALEKTCAECHPSECGREDYLAWFPSLKVVSHGKQDLSRAYRRNNCLGCHQGAGAHGEKEKINDQDCAKCHNDMIGFMHPKADSAKQPGILASAWIYQVFLAGLLWGGFRFYTRRTRHKGGG